MWKNAWEVVTKVWKDPVWSKVISAIIIGSGTVLLLKLARYTIHDAYNLVITGLTFNVPVYFLVFVLFLFLTVNMVRKSLKPKRNPIWDEQIGNYTFEELYDIMLLKRLPASYNDMKVQDGKTENLISLFHFYTLYLSHGVGQEYPLDDRGYGYNVLCPMLMTYGLVEKSEVPHKEVPEIKETVFHTSALGLRFIAQLEKILVKDPVESRKLLDPNYKKRVR